MENNLSYLRMPPEELIRASKIPLTILPDLDTLHEHFARSIANEIKQNNELGRSTRLILPVGPVGQYPLLASICNRERIHWKAVHVFNMDEYCDWQGRAIPPEHPLSFKGFMQNFIAELDPELRLPAEQLHFPDPLNLDQISQSIQAVGGIDTCYGGVGYHGHIAFNEPPISRWYRLSPEQFRASLTRIVPLAPETIVMNSIRATGGNPAELPPMAVTLGMGDILSAGRIRLYCHGGAWQRTILRIALMSEEDVDYPVTLLQNHPDYEVVTTQDSAQPPRPATAA